MNRWLGMLLLLLALSVWKLWPKGYDGPAVLATDTLVAVTQDQGAQEDPCQGKERCVVAYIAPWCGACKAVTPQLLEVRNHWKSRNSSTRGMKFVVGADSPENCSALVQQIGDGAVVDVGDAFGKAMKVTHYPTIWVIDQASKVLSVDREAIRWLNQEMRL